MNADSPFTPFQQELILYAAGVAVLMAGWFVLRAFHPRWRPSGQIRYTPLALAVLLVVCAADFVVAARAVQVIAHHPFWAIVPPMLASALARTGLTFTLSLAPR